VPLVALGAARRWLVVAAAIYPVYAAASFGHAYTNTRLISYGLAVVVLVWLAVRERIRPAVV
jgi:hypothetical protein